MSKIVETIRSSYVNGQYNQMLDQIIEFGSYHAAVELDAAVKAEYISCEMAVDIMRRFMMYGAYKEKAIRKMWNDA